MDPSILEMQQEAARRVERMHQASRRIAGGGIPPGPPTYRRTATSMRAHRPPPYTPLHDHRPSPPLPPAPEPKPPCDSEQLLLLLLALFLRKNGGSPTLIFVLLYLAL